jgi:hypothetical protein
MIKSILISIQPKWCAAIASGKKSIEVRKNKPTMKVPFKVFIYCTQGNKYGWFAKHNGVLGSYSSGFNGVSYCGKVVGEFICDRICVYPFLSLLSTYYETKNGEFDLDNKLNWIYGTYLYYDELVHYADGKDLYGWHISNLKIYDEPKELSRFGKFGFGHKVPLKMPPQSWCYVEELL